MADARRLHGKADARYRAWSAQPLRFARAFLPLALAAVPAAASPVLEDSPETLLVRKFIAAADANDPAAKAMLADDAMMGAGDVGGPMTVDLYRGFSKQLAERCRLDAISPESKALGMPGKDVRTVDVVHICKTDAGGERKSTLVFAVEKGRIAGAYLIADDKNG